MLLNNNFDVDFYTSYYKDLSHLNREQAIKHYDLHGKKENRITDVEKDFDWEFYTTHYDDLKNIKSKSAAYLHYKKFGKHENRVTNNEMLKIYNCDLQMLKKKWTRLHKSMKKEKHKIKKYSENLNLYEKIKNENKNIYYLLCTMSQLPLYISLITESSKRGYRNIMILRNHSKDRYDISKDIDKIFENSAKYNFLVVHSLSIDFTYVKGIVFMTDGDLHGPPRHTELNSSLTSKLIRNKVISISLALDFNFWAVYKHYIDKVDYANFICKEFVSQVENFPNTFFNGIVDITDKSVFKSSKNIFLGNTKFDNLINKDKIYSKYNLDKKLKYCVFLFPKILSNLEKSDFVKLYNLLRSNGYKIIVKTRPKDYYEFERLNDDGSLEGDFHVNSETFPNETLELMKVSELCVISSSSANFEAIYCKIPLIDIESDLRPNYITRNEYLLDKKIYRQFDIKTWTNWTNSEFKKILNSLKKKDDEYFDIIFKKYYDKVDTSIKLLDFIENTEKFKNLFVN